MAELSTCCDSTPWLETDLCGNCKEHADFYDEGRCSELNESAKRICDKNIDNHCRSGCPLEKVCAAQKGDDESAFVERMNKAANQVHNDYGV